MDIGQKIASLERQIADLQRSARLSSASLDDTALLVRDGTGSLRGIVGQQGDGTTAVTIVNGPPPPQPSAPLVLSVLGGVTASWDGLFTDGVLPLDWSRTEVHAGPEDGFTPSAGTLQSTIETAQGATVIVPTDTPVYVRFVARSTSGTASAPSAQTGPYGPEPVVVPDGTITTVKLADDAVTAAKVAVGAVDSTAIQDGAVLEVALHDAAVSTGKLATDAVTSPKLAANSVIAGKIAANAVTAATVAAGAITTDKLTVTGGANILTDPSFEGAYTAAIISGLSHATQDTTKGNGSPTSLRINAVSASPAYRSVQLTTLPVLPGDQIRLGIDYWVSADWAGTEVNFQIRWETAAGGIISYGKASTTSPVRDAWTALSGTYTAPATAAVARIRVESGNAAAGTVWWDNASVRPVLPGTQIQDGAVTTAKIVAGAVQTLQLDAESVNASKIAAGAVTTAKLDALAVTADKIAANTITAGKLAVGSVDATALKADAITGKTITGGTITGTSIVGGTVTGSTIQTATTGRRVVINTTGVIQLWSGRAAGETPGTIESGITSDGEMELGYLTIKPPTHGPTPPEFTMAVGPSGERQWRVGPLAMLEDGTTSAASILGKLYVSDSIEVGSGIVFADPGWNSLSFGTGWTGYGTTFGSGRFRAMPDGSVVVRDLAKRTATTTLVNGEIIATLPTGYRPAITFQVNQWVGAGPGGGSLSVNVNSAGQISLNNISTGANTYLAAGTGYLSLNQIQFWLD
ncbi:hypothetical protein [Streptomyces californicus]|uniref:hypothetical protein n=1 Tax=Streptomyces californicus TaxID=67351 RepID=UPI00381D2AF0